ncbi:MAG: sigma-70 family RNA polymerase sigma factor [Thermomicrobiales bacterium]
MPTPAHVTDEFERERVHLRSVACRMLGSVDDADDAIQETWLRVARSDASSIANRAAWFTTILSSICLDMLRQRARRDDIPLDILPPATTSGRNIPDPEDAALIRDAVSDAMTVVLLRLGPAERVAFVLHEVFGYPFADIAPILDRSVDATKKLASRARSKVMADCAYGTTNLDDAQVIAAFLAAASDGDVETLLTLLAPEVVRVADRRALAHDDQPLTLIGADAVARETRENASRAARARLVVINSRIGAIVADEDTVHIALRFRIARGRITRFEIVAEPATLTQLDLRLVPGTCRFDHAHIIATH